MSDCSNPCIPQDIIIPGCGSLWQLYDIQDDNPEICLYESVIEEFTSIAGFPVEYYVNIFNHDQLYGEDENNRFADPITTKLIYEPTEETQILNQFGITSDETLSFALIPKITFITDIGETIKGIDNSFPIVPTPGDVIHTLWNDKNYEVVDVGAEQHIFNAKKMIWEFILKPFRWSAQSESHKEIFTGMDSSTFSPLPSASDGKPIEDTNLQYGDNSWVENESDTIDDYPDIDTKIFGF